MRKLIGVVAVTGGLALALSATAPLTPAIAAPGNPIAGFEYVALGDSYAAGFGLLPVSESSPFPGTPNGCYQAETNYPHLVATDLGLTLTDQTCSGAITANVGYEAGVSIPSPPATGPLLGLPTGSEPQTTASGMVAPDVQSAGLSTSTDIVTVSIDGADLGFASIATACVRMSVGAGSNPVLLDYAESIEVDNCQQYFDDQAAYPGSYLKDRLATFVAPRIEATLAHIREAAPNAQVFVVGYPQLTPGSATDTCFTPPGSPDAVPLSGVDLNYINEIEHLLDEELHTAATAHGAHYIHTWGDTPEHTLCTPDPWITGLTGYLNLSATCDPGYIKGDEDGWVCVQFGALHPNSDGVESLRQLVAAQIPTAFFTTIIDGNFEPGGTMTVEGGGFYPGETVELVLHSTPVTVATVTANALGGFSTTAAIPTNVPPGAHTLVATGAASGHAFSASVDLKGLAVTGADLAGPTIAGGVLVLLGVVIMLSRRRRTPRLTT